MSPNAPTDPSRPSAVAPPPPPGVLDPLARRTRDLDLVSSLLTAGFLAVIEMGGGLAKKGFGASDLQVALLTSGQSLGLMLSFFIAHLAARRPRMGLVFWPELASRLLLVAVFFLTPRFAFLFVAAHTVSQMLQAMTTPARVTIYRLNYPTEIRGRIVGRIRQLQLVLTAGCALAMSVALDWSSGEEELVRWLGPPGIDPQVMITWVVPALAAIGLLGTFIFNRVPVRAPEPGPEAPTLRETFGRFVRVYREDRDFRRYENFFFLFGFANIMTIPLTQIHAVEVLNASYLDLACINVVIVQGFMAITMAFWGRKLDRHSPGAMRGILNLIDSVDFLVLAVAPTVGWVYLGRVFRGTAMGGGTLIWMLGALYYARQKEDAPIYLGVHTVLTGLRWLLAPFAGVWLKAACGHSARPIFFISFALIVVSGLCMIRDARRERTRRPVEETMPAPRTPGA